MLWGNFQATWLLSLLRPLTWAIDTIAPKCSISVGGVEEAPWITKELQTLKRGRQLEQHWQKTKVTSNWIVAKAHYRPYAVVMMATNNYLTTTIASAKSWQVRPLHSERSFIFWLIGGDTWCLGGPLYKPLCWPNWSCWPLPNVTITSREAVEGLHHSLKMVMGWIMAKKLKLNPDRTEVLLVWPDLALERGNTVIIDGIKLP